jgi:hypothetical protein
MEVIGRRTLKQANLWQSGPGTDLRHAHNLVSSTAIVTGRPIGHCIERCLGRPSREIPYSSDNPGRVVSDNGSIETNFRRKNQCTTSSCRNNKGIWQRPFRISFGCARRSARRSRAGAICTSSHAASAWKASRSIHSRNWIRVFSRACRIQQVHMITTNVLNIWSD